MTQPNAPKIHLVGGGIASLAAAAFLIRDGDVPGCNITILEGLDRVGGSLDGAGSPEGGYVLRGGRMLESKYVCTFGLFSSIPTLDGRETVTQETFAWNETIKTSSKSRLVRDGRRQTSPAFGLSERQILAIELLVIEPEAALGRSSIADRFDPSFFKTDFWFMWCTTFAFQPWHSAVEFRRYLVRFVHMVEGFGRLHGIMRTVYNQYDSMVRPLVKWLDDRGVVFRRDTLVTDLDMIDDGDGFSVTGISFKRGNETGTIPVPPGDLVFVTLGSMTDASSLGANDAAPLAEGDFNSAAWALWKRIATGRPGFGKPAVFSDHVEQSEWFSFTATLHDPKLLRSIRDLTGNVAGEGGLVTFPDSAWLASIVVPYQPHFIGQPDGVEVLWGYGLSVGTPGDFVAKPMSECTGREIMTEILGHLQIGAAERILDSTVCIPCRMPFITSQFLRRGLGDRPQVVPHGSKNLAFVGQFVELPEDVVFTVEYSIRSAQIAAYGLLGLDRSPPPVYRGEFDPRVLYKAFMTLHDRSSRGSAVLDAAVV